MTLARVPGTAPYPWPWDGGIDPHRSALLVAGADARWRSRSIDAPSVQPVIAGLVDAVRAAGGIVVRVHHGASPGAARAVFGAVAPSAAFLAALGSVAATVVA